MPITLRAISFCNLDKSLVSKRYDTHQSPWTEGVREVHQLPRSQPRASNHCQGGHTLSMGSTVLLRIDLVCRTYAPKVDS